MIFQFLVNIVVESCCIIIRIFSKLFPFNSTDEHLIIARILFYVIHLIAYLYFYHSTLLLFTCVFTLVSFEILRFSNPGIVENTSDLIPLRSKYCKKVFMK